MPPNSVPWVWWAFAAVMVLLQLVTLIVIAGRPSAVAVIGVVLPLACGVCGLVATGIILDYVHAMPPHERDYSGDLIALLYVIWGICGVVGGTAAVLCMVLLRRGVPAAASNAVAADKLSEVARSPE